MLPTILDFLVVSFFISWFLLTVLKHLPVRVMRKFGNFLLSPMSLRFIPIWNFFAPNPASHTYHLLYRDQSKDGKMTNWHEIKIPQQEWSRVFWNPSKSFNKGILDIVLEFTQLIPRLKDHQEIIKVSLPYLTILSYLSYVQRSIEPFATQFLLLQSSSSAGFEILFLSDFHQL
jgi:hypothetical protein